MQLDCFMPLRSTMFWPCEEQIVERRMMRWFGLKCMMAVYEFVLHFQIVEFIKAIGRTLAKCSARIGGAGSSNGDGVANDNLLRVSARTHAPFAKGMGSFGLAGKCCQLNSPRLFEKRAQN